MYKIKNFKIGDEIYKHAKGGWRLCGKIVAVTDECYGMRISSITGIIMTKKELFETQGYIGSGKSTN